MNRIPSTPSLSLRERGIVVLLCQPGVEVGVDAFGERDEFVVLVDGEAHQRDQVGEDAAAAGAFDPGLFQRGVGLPELGFVPQVGRGLDPVGQFLDVLEAEARLVGPGIEDLQGGDLVLVLFDELLEGSDDAPGAVGGRGAEAGFDDLVLADVVDGDLVFLFHLDQEIAELGIVQGFDGFLNDLGSECFEFVCLRHGFPGFALLNPGYIDGVGVEGLDHAAAEVLDAVAARCGANSLVVLLAHAVLHAGQAAGEGGEHVLVGVAEADGLQQLLEADCRFLLHGPGVGLVLLAHADGIDDDEVVLGFGVRGDRLQVVGLDDPHAAALHLLEEGAGFDRAHEHDDLHRLDVGAGGDHVHGDGDAREMAVAEGLDEVLGLGAGGAVGDLLGEVVALAEFLAQDLDDVLGVVVVLGEEQGFGNLGAAGEDFGEQLVAEGAHDGADLVRGDHVAVELVGVVFEVVVELLPALLARVAVLLFT